jgi:hypothetical protein
MAFRPLIILSAVALLAGCNAWQNRAEFAAPQSRWPTNQPSAVPANAPAPPIQAQYCYRTLAAVDCFTEAHPERITGYTGVYPDPDAISAAAPYAAKPKPAPAAVVAPASPTQAAPSQPAAAGP